MLTKNERLVRHKIFDILLSFLENKILKIKGQIVPYVLHPLTRKALINDGLSKDDIDQLERSIIEQASESQIAEVFFDTPKNLYFRLKEQGNEAIIFENRIVPIPSSLLNALISAELANSSSTYELNLAGIFILIQDFDIDGKPCEEWRIDIDKKYASRGFIVPIFDEDHLIKDLYVFRYPGDERPFILRARANFIHYTK